MIYQFWHIEDSVVLSILAYIGFGKDAFMLE